MTAAEIDAETARRIKQNDDFVNESMPTPADVSAAHPKCGSCDSCKPFTSHNSNVTALVGRCMDPRSRQGIVEMNVDYCRFHPLLDSKEGNDDAITGCEVARRDQQLDWWASLTAEQREAYRLEFDEALNKMRVIAECVFAALGKTPLTVRDKSVHAGGSDNPEHGKR